MRGLVVLARELTRLAGINSAIREARNARIALARILGQVDMPEAGTAAQIHGRKAINARWAEAS